MPSFLGRWKSLVVRNVGERVRRFGFIWQLSLKEKQSEVAHSCPRLGDPMDSWSRLLGPWDFPGTTTGVGTFFICKMETTWYLPHTIGCWKDQMKRSSEPSSIDT